MYCNHIDNRDKLFLIGFCKCIVLRGIKSLWIVWQSQVFDEHLYPLETEHSR